MVHMLTDTLFRHPRTQGIQLLQRRGEAGAHEITTHRIHLDTGGAATFAAPAKKRSSSCRKGAACSPPRIASGR